MSKLYRLMVLLVVGMLMASCAAPAPYPPELPVLPEVSIARHPEPVNFSGFNVFTSPPVYDPASTEYWQVDLRSADLTKLDLSKSTADLLYADFDSQTQWPPSEKMPADFNWQTIMEVGKDPGPGMRALHEQGITGRGIGIAIIDQTLLVDHMEYKDRLRVYEEAEDITGVWMEAQMHGPAVASIAVGRSVGVAPEADLYYIATGDCGGAADFRDLDFSCRARAIQRIVEINQGLPENRKIRVLSMSIGWGPDTKGYDEITAAVKEAKEAGIFVISTSLSRIYQLEFHGLGRSPLPDPNDFWSYTPGLWWQDDFYQRGFSSPTLLVPMDSRTTASPTGAEDYVFYRQGGWSWSVPYIAGMYALAVQVKPEITPEQFWEAALDTGKTIHIEHKGKVYEFGVILDPQALIEALKTK
jgi:subtilisin family serine protease